MESILIIEDDPFLQHYYKLVLTRAGYSLIFEESTEKIFELINDNKIKLIIMDINLRNTYFGAKEVNGIQLSRHIKENLTGSIPIILVSAQHDSVRQITKESLADDFILKPIVDLNLLVSKVKYLIDINGKT